MAPGWAGSAMPVTGARAGAAATEGPATSMAPGGAGSAMPVTGARAGTAATGAMGAGSSATPLARTLAATPGAGAGAGAGS